MAASVTGFANRLERRHRQRHAGPGAGHFPGVGFVGAGGAYRQRQNVDAVKVRGVEASAGWTSGPWSVPRRREPDPCAHGRVRRGNFTRWAAPRANARIRRHPGGSGGSATARAPSSWSATAARNMKTTSTRAARCRDDVRRLGLVAADQPPPAHRPRRKSGRCIGEAGIGADGSVERATPRTLVDRRSAALIALPQRSVLRVALSLGMYRSNLDTRDKSGAIAAVIAIHAGLLLAFLHLSGKLDLADPQSALSVFNLAQPRRRPATATTGAAQAQEQGRRVGAQEHQERGDRGEGPQADGEAARFRIRSWLRKRRARAPTRPRAHPTSRDRAPAPEVPAAARAAAPAGTAAAAAATMASPIRHAWSRRC